jgi:hypothetical protein
MCEHLGITCPVAPKEGGHCGTRAAILQTLNLGSVVKTTPASLAPTATPLIVKPTPSAHFPSLPQKGSVGIPEAITIRLG